MISITGEGDASRSRPVSLRPDLVDVGACNAFLALAVISGERLYCADLDAGDEFDLYVLRRAGDLEPFERERRRILLTPDLSALQGRQHP